MTDSAAAVLLVTDQLMHLPYAKQPWETCTLALFKASGRCMDQLPCNRGLPERTKRTLDR